MMILPPLFTSGQDAGGELVLRVAMQDDIKGLNPLTVSDYWSNLVLQWVYETPILVDYDSQELMPYIAVGSANLSGKADSWADCAVGNFGYIPRAQWENASKPEAIIFYDFTNVTWHDGEQMSVRDIMFSYHVAARNQLSDMSCLMDDWSATDYWYSPEKDPDTMHVEVVWQEGNRAALRFTLQEPYAEFFRLTLSPLLLPYHIWGSATSGQAVNETNIWCDDGYNASSPDSWQLNAAISYPNEQPIGSGLFEFGGWVKGQYTQLNTYREHFYTEDFAYAQHILDHFPSQKVKQPTIDGMSFYIYKTGEAALYALESGDIDYIAWSLSPYFFDRISAIGSIFCFQSGDAPTYFSSYPISSASTEYSTYNDGFFYIGYNMRKTSFGYRDGNASMGDVGKPLRQAIAHCVDRGRIVTRLLRNFGTPGRGPVSPLSEWFNDSVPTYGFDPSEAKQILADAGYKVKVGSTLLSGQAAIDAAGDPNWWYNPDETPIGSSTGGMIEFFTPQANYDPIRAQAGLMIAQQLRDIGIYAEAHAYSFGEILDRIEVRDYDMYILGWNDLGNPSDYLYDMFHSDNAVFGQNYVGYQNASFDALIDTARATDNQTVRRQAIFDAQAAIAGDLPVDVLYWRNRVLAYTGERFFGWIQHGREIFHRDSIVNLRGPYLYKLYAMFDRPQLAVYSNSTTQFAVSFKDDESQPAGDISIKLNTTIGSLAAEAGTAGEGGRFATTFTAPYVAPTADNIANGSLAFIQIRSATCERWDYAPAPPRFILVTVYPEEARFITVKITADPDVIEDVGADGTTPGFTYLDVEVRDQDGLPCENASVNLTCPSGQLLIEPESTLANQAGHEFRVSAAEDLQTNDSSVLELILVAEVRSVGAHEILEARGYATVFLQDSTQQEAEAPIGTEYPVAEVAVVVAGICIAALAYAVLRRRSQR